MTGTDKPKLLPALQITTNQLVGGFNQIPAPRKETLNELTRFIQTKVAMGEPVYLNFICTHNSRRSHIAQLWAQAAAYFYEIKHVVCFSGGTEATAFNPRAVKALQNVGFEILKTNAGDNPMYEVRYAKEITPVMAFSKTYNDPFNQQQNFAAVMTCSHADANCPIVSGAIKRIALTYTDPKEFDDTPHETAGYAERVHEIGQQILFAFSNAAEATIRRNMPTSS